MTAAEAAHVVAAAPSLDRFTHPNRGSARSGESNPTSTDTRNTTYVRRGTVWGMQNINLRTVYAVCLAISTIAALFYLYEWAAWLYGVVTEVVSPFALAFWAFTVGLTAYLFFGNPTDPEGKARRSIQRILEINTALLMLTARDIHDPSTRVAVEKVLAGDNEALKDLAKATLPRTD